jgi:hypothetical protein
MEKDGGTKYTEIYDVYADSEDEALEKIREKVGSGIKMTDLYYDYDEVVEVIAPTKKAVEVILPTKKVVKLSNLKKGDRFTFPLSQEDYDMGVSERIYVFDRKSKSTFFYKSGDSEFSTSENRNVNLLSKEVAVDNSIEETTDVEDLLKLMGLD